MMNLNLFTSRLPRRLRDLVDPEPAVGGADSAPDTGSGELVTSRDGHIPREVAAHAGFAMMEIILGIAVFATLSAAAWALYTEAFGGGRANAANQELFSLQTAIKSSYGRQTDFGAVGTDLVGFMTATDAAPESMVTSTNELVNAFGGTVTATSNGRTFFITFNGIPSEACVDMATLSSDGAGIRNVAINGGSAVLSANMDVATAATQCTNTGSGGDGSTSTDGNSLTWEMAR